MPSHHIASQRVHPYIAMYGIEDGAMAKIELSDRFISNLKPQEIAVDFFDSKTRGLNLRITPRGVKAWSVVFTSPKDGKRASKPWLLSGHAFGQGPRSSHRGTRPCRGWR